MMGEKFTQTNGFGPKKIYKTEMACADGNWATAHAAYRTNDSAFIFPITPSSPMGEEVDAWAAKHKKNLFGQDLQVVEMQSEAGAAGALHGALVTGSLATTFTASQGLLLYIPNLYKISGELLPTVIHVASRALAGEALSIYGDHSDTMLVRGCGLAMLSSFTVQEAHDMAVISQVATLNSRVPFLHFMDGFRTSHEINKINLVSDEQLRDLMPFDKIEEHRARAMSPLHPSQRGTAQAPDVFMQLVESSNSHYTAVDGIVARAFDHFAHVTGRQYHPFEYRYHGTTQPRVAIITMGSSVRVVELALKHLKSEQACLVGVRQFRPWNAEMFVRAIPPSVKRVAVLDRTREGGSLGEPLYLDVCTSLLTQKRNDIFVAGGRYGLGSKDFTPRMVQAVINNILRKDISDVQTPFTVGITDDVTNLSLSLGRPLNCIAPETTECVLWGFGSDGTVGASKESIKMIGNYHRDMSVQAYFEYDAKKSSGWTLSHLRFSPKTPIDAPFRVEEGQAGYVACHNESYVQANKFDVPKYLKRHGTFFLNTSVASIKDPEERIKALEDLMSAKVLRKLALRNAKFFIMDAGRLAAKFGLAGRINMICTCVFFRLSGVLPLDDAVALLKAAIRRNYGYKGEQVVQRNIDLLDTVVSDTGSLIQVEIPSRWRSLAETERSFSERHLELISDEKARKFMEEIGDPVTRLEGDEIPVSAFLENNLLGGVMIPGTTKFEKRNPNPSGSVPIWESSNCTQCNQCVFVCPHAAIRPFIVTKDEQSNAPHPEHFDCLRATGPEFAGKRYRLQVSVLDCTGCNACVEACPEAPKALVMGDLKTAVQTEKDNWNYAIGLPDRGRAIDKSTVRGSQFQTPLMEFSGACMGCGETPYFKLLTQLFGERMLIANATGCSTIWGGSFPSNPYTVNAETGRGPAWANSLFEDNAEFGLGMFASTKHRRERLISLVQEYTHVADLVDKKELAAGERELLPILLDWLEVRMEKSDKCTFLFDKMKPMLKELVDVQNESNARHELLKQIWSDRDMFPRISQWITGGDGWAYDIGYGGLDHTAAFANHDVNILVVDTEMYSNTGGQQSKATPAGAAVKFAMGGKIQKKKNLGEIFMSYEHIYVASVALHNQAQTLQAFLEADQHDGPSVVIAYAPCIQQGVRPQGLNDMFDECKFAVDSGYWPLYRYKPSLAESGQNPFILDSKKLRKDVTAFLQRENRFINLRKREPRIAEQLWETMNRDVHHRMEHLQQMAEGYKHFSDTTDAQVVTLFASETGMAARVAQDFAAACPISAAASALDDIDIEDIDGKTIVFFVATCGQGSMPRNGKDFFSDLKRKQEPFSDGTRFLMFGLGDSSYYFFVKAAKDIEEVMLALGAKPMVPFGIGDDSAEEGLDQGLHEWLDKVWPALSVDPPKEVPHITPVECSFSENAIILPEDDQRMLEAYFHSDDTQATFTTVLSNELMCSPEYDRDFRTIRLTKGEALEYNLGDVLDIYPRNDPQKVSKFLRAYSPDFGEHTVVKVRSWGMEGEISLGAIFGQILDIFGKPSKHFLHQLSSFSTDTLEKEEMLDPSFLKNAAKESGMTVADALLRFKHCHPPLPALLAMIPPIKPRAYSIASAPRRDNNIELLVLIETWWCNEGKRVGLNCDMLRQLKPGDFLWCRVRPGSMEPPSPSQSVVCVGIGSGLAPHMAFLRDRVRAAEDGEEVGPLSLYFGNRYRKEEFLYENELTTYESKYPWFKLHAAFSRDDPKKKVYVQDLVGATEDARRLLRDDPEGMLYVCGNRNLPKPLQSNLVKCFTDEKHTSSEAGTVVERLYVEGRAQQEVW